MPKAAKSAIENRPFNELQDELQSLVAWFESDEFVIEQAAEKYQRAQLLIAAMQTQLDSVKNEIDRINLTFES